MDAVDKGRHAMIIGKNRFIAQLACIGKSAKEIKDILQLMDWDAELAQAIENFKKEELQNQK